jgi:steroid 5-alpha reductase family enzyme
MDKITFYYIVLAWSILAVLTYIMLSRFIVAPFGRHTRKDFGPMINNTLGWVIMESVSLIVFLYFFISGSGEKSMINWLFAALWSAHYINRSFIYPFRQKNKKRKMPVAIFISAIFFNMMNGFLNGYYLGNFVTYATDWLYSPQFIIGIILFIGGMIINDKSDAMLLALRKPGESGYKIPRGFLFEKVSCPNHLGEIIEWTGYAIMTWNIASFSFALWTFANLAPRSEAHHKWYKEHFKDYPKNRKAVIPFLY